MSDKKLNLASSALRLVVAYDDLMLRYTGPVSELTKADTDALDEAYDQMVAAARITLDVTSRATPPAPSEHVAGWQDISTAPKNTKVLAAYRNELGNWRIVTACYHTELPWSDEYGDHEEEFAPEAWYEESDSSEVIYQTSRQPTNWQPLPAPPATKEGKDNG